MTGKTGTMALSWRLACGSVVGAMLLAGPGTYHGAEAGAPAASVLQYSDLLRNLGEPFSISLVPAVPIPIRLGTRLGFNVSSDTAGYYSLYLIDPVGEVWVLAENLPLPAGSVVYPAPPAQDYRLRAAEPLGFNRVILLVTRAPFGGFSGNDTLTTARSLAVLGGAFVAQLNGATAALPPRDWQVAEITVRIVA